MGLRGRRGTLQALFDAHGDCTRESLVVPLEVMFLFPLPGVGTVLGIGRVAPSAVMRRQDVDVALLARVAGHHVRVTATRSPSHAREQDGGSLRILLCFDGPPARTLSWSFDHAQQIPRQHRPVRLRAVPGHDDLRRQHRHLGSDR